MVRQEYSIRRASLDDALALAQIQESSIRRASLDDALALAQIQESTWRETYSGLMSERMLDASTADARSEVWRCILSGQDGYLATTYVAEAMGELVAFASCGKQRNSDFAAQGYLGELTAVYVIRTAQRRSVDVHLMQAMMEDLASRGLTGFTLWVPRDNIPARSLYEKLGGQLIAERIEEGPHGALLEVAYGWASF